MNKSSYEYIDNVLSELEDIIHGEISDKITKARILLNNSFKSDNCVLTNFYNYLLSNKYNDQSNEILKNIENYLKDEL